MWLHQFGDQNQEYNMTVCEKRVNYVKIQFALTTYVSMLFIKHSEKPHPVRVDIQVSPLIRFFSC